MSGGRREAGPGTTSPKGEGDRDADAGNTGPDAVDRRRTHDVDDSDANALELRDADVDADTGNSDLDAHDRRSHDAGTSALDRRTFIRQAGGAGAALGLVGVTGGAGAAGAAEAAGGIGKGTPSDASVGNPYVHRAIPDVAVVGGGAFGAWTSFYLRRQGLDVLLLDKYGPANSKATSGGETRGVRTGYGDRPHGRQWTQWAHEAIRRWKEYDEAWKDRLPAPLFYETGDLILREESEPFLEDTRSHWDAVGVDYEVLDGDEVRHRWPAIGAPHARIALLETRAGVVRARRAIQTVVGVFRSEGGRVEVAEVRPGGRTTDGRLFDVVTDAGDAIRAGSFVFALGPWFPSAFPGIFGRKIRIPMGHVFYFGTPPGDHRFSWPNLPSYNVPGCTGWPALPPDHRGFRVRTGGSAHEDPDTSPRWVPEEKQARPREILRDVFPALADAPLVETRTCHYELSVSRNFIIDRHPDFSNAWFAGGGSAEAFKFGPVSGEYVAMRVMGLEGDPELAAAFRIPDEEYEPTTGG